MSKIFKGLPILVVATFFLLACGASSQGSTSPITPTAAVATVTAALPAKTEMPTPVPVTVSPTATSTATLPPSSNNTTTVSPTATAKFTFSPLMVTQVTTFMKAKIEVDATRWPTSVVAPVKGYFFFAFRCEGENPAMGFIKIEGEDITVLRQNCPQRAELILIAGLNDGYVLFQGFGDIVATKTTFEKDLSIDRYLFEMNGGQLVVWFKPTK